MPGATRVAGAVALWAAISTSTSSLAACGASAGTSGVAVCNVEAMREKQRKKWHVGAVYAYSDTALKFSGDAFPDRETFEQSRHAALATGQWRVTPRWSFDVSAGALLGGRFYHPVLLGSGGAVDMRPGFVGSIGASYIALQNEGAIPFVLTTAQLSAILTSTTNDDAKYRAFDLRLGAAVGWTLLRVVSPYGLVRMFGGPATWSLFGESLMGTDKHHYQIGAGVSGLILGRIDVFAEGVAFGERGVTLGAGVAF